ncbi:hypothetical protein [Runella sp.]|uniref:hypothetical protein n=1 Tax=Runella sp. TaxID=1960881 RepID=UPI003D13CD18
MKGLFLLILILFFSGLDEVQAQWRKSVGVNIVFPLTAPALELASELTAHPAYALTLNVGYTHRASFQGFSKVYDGIYDRKSSGAFVKLGIRSYLFSFANNRPAFNLFIGAQVIGSHYSQTGTLEIIDPGFSPFPQNPYLKAKGVIWGGAFTGGLTIRLAKRIAFDGGIQYGLQPTRDDYIGKRVFNYQPGFGLSRSGKQVTSIQGIVTVKYQL